MTGGRGGGVHSPHVSRHQQEQVVDVREDEEEEDGAEEHGHPGAVVLPEHLQPQVPTWRTTATDTLTAQPYVSDLFS